MWLAGWLAGRRGNVTPSGERERERKKEVKCSLKFSQSPPSLSLLLPFDRPRDRLTVPGIAREGDTQSGTKRRAAKCRLGCTTLSLTACLLQN